MKSLLKIINNTLLTLLLGLIIFSPLLIYAAPADPTSDVKDSLQKLDDTAVQAGINTTPAGQNIYLIIGKVISAGLVVLTVIFFILVIYAGVVWMSAFGNEERAEKASKTLSQAGIGLGVTLIAYLLTNFVVLRIIDIVTNKQ